MDATASSHPTAERFGKCRFQDGSFFFLRLQVLLHLKLCACVEQALSASSYLLSRASPAILSGSQQLSSASRRLVRTRLTLTASRACLEALDGADCESSVVGYISRHPTWVMGVVAFLSEDSQRTMSSEVDLLGGRKELRLGDLVEHEDLSVIEGSESLHDDSVDQCMKSRHDCLQLTAEAWPGSSPRKSESHIPHDPV